MGNPPASGWQWWRERRLPAGPIHLDSAAAGRSSRATLAASDPVSAPSAIVALRATNGQDVGKTRARLLPGIVTTAGSIQRAPRDMTEPLLRVSPHVDCTPEDLDHLRQALLALG